MEHAETVIVRNDLADLPAVYAALEGFAADTGLADGVRRTLLLVVEELFSNTVSYGYPEGTADEITVSAALGPDHVELTLTDRAMPFDSAAAPAVPDASESVDLKVVGGLGLFLVHQLAEEVRHERTGDTNRTIVRVARTADAEADT
ncbi:ATP-binding protein [Roseibium sediminicola]|uniref:ATP-binding protein n=1 Tax=Roseibium sediminicola TaxID=2933272 RepID=A0ABT0GV24_9HYPH|nr:ATP-binding protein [Roseibium sp. CAU 1639]